MGLHASPIINELSSFNSGIIEDSEGDHPDWIELYNPAAVSTDRDDYEFIEFMNTGMTDLDLTGYYFSDGITFSFPDATIIEPGGLAAFTARYGSLSIPIIGEYDGRLSNDGEQITVNAAEGPMIDFTYNDKAPWPEAADGEGPSLVLIAPGSQPDPNDASNWRISDENGGTLGGTLGGNPGDTDTESIDAWMEKYVIIDLTGDPDGDGLNNLAEYATGGDPFSYTAPVLEIFDDALSESMILKTRLDLSAMDEVGSLMQSSTDMTVWVTVNASETGAVTNDDGIIVTSYLSDTAGERRTFYRMYFWQR